MRPTVPVQLRPHAATLHAQSGPHWAAFARHAGSRTPQKKIHKLPRTASRGTAGPAGTSCQLSSEIQPATAVSRCYAGWTCAVRASLARAHSLRMVGWEA